jgi:antitoxin MazE
MTNGDLDQLPCPAGNGSCIVFVDTDMRTRIQKWGNSLALRIPKPFAEETRLSENTAVDVSVRNGKLVVVPVVEPELSLEDLVSRITPQNRHSETETGAPVGNEVW